VGWLLVLAKNETLKGEHGYVKKRLYELLILGLMDIVVERNAYGRQRESFEVDLDIPVFGGMEYRGVFIRSPAIREIGPQVEALCRLNNVAVAVRQDTMIGTAFHPELTADTRLHQLFVKAVVQQIGTGRTTS
jgi:5'-phosphate synthase pdxT subunit